MTRDNFTLINSNIYYFFVFDELVPDNGFPSPWETLERISDSIFARIFFSRFCLIFCFTVIGLAFLGMLRSSPAMQTFIHTLIFHNLWIPWKKKRNLRLVLRSHPTLGKILWHSPIKFAIPAPIISILSMYVSIALSYWAKHHSRLSTVFFWTPFGTFALTFNFPWDIFPREWENS